MKQLVLGGTRFLGRHAVEEALARGHAATVLNHGITRPDPVPGVEDLRGDRDGGLGALGNREWDVVLDTSGYYPRIVRASAQTLAGRVGLYVFVSTISVYADLSAPGLKEDAPLAVTPPRSWRSSAERHGARSRHCARMKCGGHCRDGR